MLLLRAGGRRECRRLPEARDIIRRLRDGGMEESSVGWQYSDDQRPC